MKSDILLYSDSKKDRGSKVRWLLAEMNLEYETVSRSNVPPPGYSALNPFESLPTVTVKGATFFESSAILLYLADLYSERQLAPVISSPDRPVYLQWMVFSEATLDRALEKLWAAEEIPGAGTTENIHKLRQDVQDVFHGLEISLQGRQYILGDRFSAADISLAYYLNWAESESLLEGFPKTRNYLLRMKDRPAAQMIGLFG